MTHRSAAFAFLTSIIAAKVKAGQEPAWTFLINSNALPSWFFTARIRFTGDTASAFASQFAITDTIDVFLSQATEVRVIYTPTFAFGRVTRLTASEREREREREREITTTHTLICHYNLWFTHKKYKGKRMGVSRLTGSRGYIQTQRIHFPRILSCTDSLPQSQGRSVFSNNLEERINANLSLSLSLSLSLNKYNQKFRDCIVVMGSWRSDAVFQIYCSK